MRDRRKKSDIVNMKINRQSVLDIVRAIVTNPEIYDDHKAKKRTKHPETASLTKDARIATGLTQAQFAALIHSTKRTVAAWESGEKPPGTLAQSVLRAVVDGKWPVE